MNLKKFKKSLVSIVLGSSLFLGNRGVICQQPKAWFPDEFFTTARETYKGKPGMKLLLDILEFFSNLAPEKTTKNLVIMPLLNIRIDILSGSLPGLLLPVVTRLNDYLVMIKETTDKQIQKSFKDSLCYRDYKQTELKLGTTLNRDQLQALISRDNLFISNDTAKLISRLLSMALIEICVPEKTLKVIYETLKSTIDGMFRTYNPHNKVVMLLLLDRLFTDAFPKP